LGKITFSFLSLKMSASLLAGPRTHPSEESEASTLPPWFGVDPSIANVADVRDVDTLFL
jgi:hypothetical protein